MTLPSMKLLLNQKNNTMGYKIHMRDASFKIKKSNTDQAMKALKEFVKNKKNTFINVPGVENAKTFDQAILSCRFVVALSTAKPKPLPSKEEILLDVEEAISNINYQLQKGRGGRLALENLDQAKKKLIAKPEDMIFVTGISFEGESQDGTEEEMFQAIAPFVEADSYIEMQGEDGEIWRWIFDGTTCVEKVANLSF